MILIKAVILPERIDKYHESTPMIIRTSMIIAEIGINPKCNKASNAKISFLKKGFKGDDVQFAQSAAIAPGEDVEALPQQKAAGDSLAFSSLKKMGCNHIPIV